MPSAVPPNRGPGPATLLRAVEPSDSGFLYHLAVATDPEWIRVCSHGLPTPFNISERVWTNVHTMCVIELAAGYPLGIASIYDVDERARSCWLEVVTQPAHAASADIERSAYALMAAHALKRCGLEALHIRHVPWRPPSLPSSLAATVAGNLPDYIFHDGDWWDLVIRAVNPVAEV